MSKATIHSTAIIEGMWVISDDVQIGPWCVLTGGGGFIGPRTRLWPHVVIGTEGEHKTRDPVGEIVIGADVMIREFSIVHRGTGDRDTKIGDRCFLMRNAHVAHDVTIDDDVTMSPNVTLGGHTRVHRGTTIGIGAMTHQFTTVGAFSMIGMGSVVTKDVLPFALVYGNPATFARKNTHALMKLGLPPDLTLNAASEHAVVREVIEQYQRDAARRSR